MLTDTDQPGYAVGNAPRCARRRHLCRATGHRPDGAVLTRRRACSRSDLDRPHQHAHAQSARSLTAPRSRCTSAGCARRAATDPGRLPAAPPSATPRTAPKVQRLAALPVGLGVVPAPAGARRTTDRPRRRRVCVRKRGDTVEAGAARRDPRLDEAFFDAAAAKGARGLRAGDEPPRPRAIVLDTIGRARRHTTPGQPDAECIRRPGLRLRRWAVLRAASQPATASMTGTTFGHWRCSRRLRGTTPTVKPTIAPYRPGHRHGK